jgi:putative ribosome biogenesis GTPase RsgA
LKFPEHTPVLCILKTANKIKMPTAADTSKNISSAAPVMLVLGLTGAGKSTFINTITKSESLPVGHTLNRVLRSL